MFYVSISGMRLLEQFKVWVLSLNFFLHLREFIIIIISVSYTKFFLFETWLLFSFVHMPVSSHHNENFNSQWKLSLSFPCIHLIIFSFLLSCKNTNFFNRQFSKEFNVFYILSIHFEKEIYYKTKHFWKRKELQSTRIIYLIQYIIKC